MTNPESARGGSASGGDPAARCAELIRESARTAALTGAGISTGAGIPDFRGPQGLYITRRYDPDKVFNYEYFLSDPEPFYDFARDFVALEDKLEPTFGHRFLQKLETTGRFLGIATQNIDFLHQRAGSKNVIELHGSFLTSHCLECAKEYSYEQLKAKLDEGKIPHCECEGLIKPDIVFFGESVQGFNEASKMAEQADLFFVIGTSCTVFPAASLPGLVGGKIVVVNESVVDLPTKVHLSVKENIDEFFKRVENHLD